MSCLVLLGYQYSDLCRLPTYIRYYNGYYSTNIHSWYVIWVPKYLVLTVSHNSILSPIWYVIWVCTQWGTFNENIRCYFILHYITSCYFMWLHLHKVWHIYESGLSSRFPLLVVPRSPFFFNVKLDHHEHHWHDVHVISCYFYVV